MAASIGDGDTRILPLPGASPGDVGTRIGAGAGVAGLGGTISTLSTYAWSALVHSRATVES